MAKVDFKKDFWWGGALSVEQVDGRNFRQNGITVWDNAFAKHPQKFFQSRGPNKAIEFSKNFAQDLELFGQIGLNSLRYGFSWSRLFPDGKKLNQEAVKYYHDLIRKAKTLNIELVMQIHHYDLPQWALAKGGWLNLEVVNQFLKYCDFLFKEYGQKVKYFATFNEPIVSIASSYLWKTHPPFINNPAQAMQASFNMILAHAKVVNLFNDKYANQTKAKIGFVGDIAFAYPKDNHHFSNADQVAANNYNLIFTYAMHDAMILGKFPSGLKTLLSNLKVLPTYTLDDLKTIAKVKINFLGLNYYYPIRVQASQNGKTFEEKIAQNYKWKEARINVFRGWEIYPQALYEAMMIVKNRYHNIPFFIAENGMGVQKEWQYRNPETREIEDDYRIAFIKEHLEVLHQGIVDGANCFGYHLWSPIDCWSFLNGFKNTYGLIEVDLKNDLKRRFKKSAYFYHNLIKNNGFNNQYPEIEEFFDLTKIKFKKSV